MAQIPLIALPQPVRLALALSTPLMADSMYPMAVIAVTFRQ